MSLKLELCFLSKEMETHLEIEVSLSSVYHFGFLIITYDAGWLFNLLDQFKFWLIRHNYLEFDRHVIAVWRQSSWPQV